MKLHALCPCQVIHGHFYPNQKVILHWLLELHWCTKLGQEVKCYRYNSSSEGYL